MPWTIAVGHRSTWRSSAASQRAPRRSDVTGGCLDRDESGAPQSPASMPGLIEQRSAAVTLQGDRGATRIMSDRWQELTASWLEASQRGRVGDVRRLLRDGVHV